MLSCFLPGLKPQGFHTPASFCEKRNVFWTNDTKRVRKGKVIARSQDTWFEPFISASGQYQPTLHQVNLPGGYRISATPMAQQDYKKKSEVRSQKSEVKMKEITLVVGYKPTLKKELFLDTQCEKQSVLIPSPRMTPWVYF